MKTIHSNELEPDAYLVSDSSSHPFVWDQKSRKQDY